MSRYPNPIDYLSSEDSPQKLPLVLLCEHAGHMMPPHLNHLGLHGTDRTRHIAWDIGIDPIVRFMAAELKVPALLALYSRLIVDCNRPLTHPELFWPFEDETLIPGNQNLSEEEKIERLNDVYDPYHKTAQHIVDQSITRFGAKNVIVINMHSFTPARRDEFGGPRPWEICLSTCKPHKEENTDAMERLATLLENQNITIGRHQPFDIRGTENGSHCHAARTQQVLIEIRQDLIETPENQIKWAKILSNTLPKLFCT